VLSYILFGFQVLTCAGKQAIRRAAYDALGESTEAAARHMEATPEVYGVVMGDVARVSQIVTNLTRYVFHISSYSFSEIYRTAMPASLRHKYAIFSLPMGYNKADITCREGRYLSLRS